MCQEVFRVGGLMIRKIALAMILSGVAGVASATVPPGVTCTTHWFLGIIPYEVCTSTPPQNPNPVRAPEIDGASAIAGLTLMIGGLAVLRGRRSKVVAKV
jgi:hypothetical protein